MDLGILKKKLSSYKTDGGYVKNVSSDLSIEILSAWESWTGPLSGFYSSLGIKGKSGARMIGEAKKLKREGFATDGFKEIQVAGVTGLPPGPWFAQVRNQKVCATTRKSSSFIL